MNIDVDYGNSQALADLRAPADDFFWDCKFSGVTPE